MTTDMKRMPDANGCSYFSLYESGELKRRVEKALSFLSTCLVCPVGCHIDRMKDEKGECGVGRFALVSSYGPHFGEEPVLRGYRGSGTVFFAGCNLHCVYCQNYDISQLRMGKPVTPERLSEIFLEIQRMGCHNLNWVTPTHVVPQLLEALYLAVQRGFRLPIVYNTSSYDSLLCLKLLDGVVDIYMPDIKYSDSQKGLKYSGIKSYFEVVKRTLKEMHRQVGVLQIDNGIARRGLLIRHLVLPNDVAGSKACLEFIARELSPDSYVNVMEQYYPHYHAGEYPDLSRPLTAKEYKDAVLFGIQAGIHRGIPFDALSRRVIAAHDSHGL